jgi:predicted DNA-binding protein
MSDDALERLKKRQRPSVPTRDASLTSSSPDISTSRYQELNIQEVKTQESNTQEVKTQEPELKTKQSTIRLEAELSNRLSEVCKSNGISREVLIEALFEHYESNPEAWEAIISLAKTKNDHRMKNANLKRAKSMMQKFS